jgi:hypothetical protein
LLTLIKIRVCGRSQRKNKHELIVRIVSAIQSRLFILRICAVLTFSIVFGTAGFARAWYFPEHAELSCAALQDHAPGYVIEALDSALRDANVEGLHLCPGSTRSLKSIGLERDSIAICVSYGALTALAGDHSNDVIELRKLLGLATTRLWPGDDVQIARLLTGSVVANWTSFLESASTEEVRVWTASLSKMVSETGIGEKMGRRSWVAKLDIELTMLDHEYVSRATGSNAHFHNATLAIHQILKGVLAGDLDNALAQTLVHHARSLQLALLSRRASSDDERRALVTEALLEHAFAVHFLEDGFASGHLAVDPSFAESFSRKQRHDYFNRQGIEMTRALDKEKCSLDFDSTNKGGRGAPNCWFAHGDGYATMTDRRVVGEAVARLQTVFALALVEPINEPTGASKRQQYKSNKSLDSADWLLDPERKDGTPRKHFRRALREIDRVAVAPARSAGKSELQVYSEDSRWLGCPLKQQEGGDPRCKGQYTELLWRPLLEDWPMSVARIETLEGSEGFGGGVSYQFSARAGLGCGFFCSNAVFATATGTAGLGVTATGLFPWHRQYSFLEGNAGAFFEPLLGNDDKERFTMGLVVEVRLPITTLLVAGTAYLWTSRLPTELLFNPFRLGLFGARVFWRTTGKSLQLRGWDIEVADIRLSAADERVSPSRSNVTDTELRFYLGCENFSSSMDEPLNGVFTIKAEVVGGYYGYF